MTKFHQNSPGFSLCHYGQQINNFSVVLLEYNFKEKHLFYVQDLRIASWFQNCIYRCENTQYWDHTCFSWIINLMGPMKVL